MMERYRLAVFVAVQPARTFGELERISGMISVLTDKMEAIGSTKEQAMEMGLSSGERYREDIFLRQLVQQVSHIDLLLKRTGIPSGNGARTSVLRIRQSRSA